MVIEVSNMRNRKKETVKSVVLGILVLLSLTLSYLIITYQPDYEIFTKRSTQKTVDSNKNNLLNFLIPDSVVKNQEGTREEAVIQTIFRIILLFLIEFTIYLLIYILF